MTKNSKLIFSLIRNSLITSGVFMLVGSCSSQNAKAFLPEPPGYSSNTKEVTVLHKSLLEISGIAYLENGSLAAINDEVGRIFTDNLSSTKPPSFKFGDKNDYEDLVKTDSLYYVMESNGTLHKIPVSNPGNATVIPFHKKRKVEFESLYQDRRSGKLMLLSKEQKLINDALVVYAFDPVMDTFSFAPQYIIPLKEVTSLMQDYSAEFKPSAAAVHPVLNKLFIIASVGKTLVVSSLDGKVEKAYTLNPVLFPQPEGICFAPNGDMFISNEGLQGKATIVKFPYKAAAGSR
jgi:hypothetical protein